MYGDLYVDRAVTIPADQLDWRFSRSGGPGGQGVNTTDSRVELRFDLAGTNAIPAHLKERALARLAPRLLDGVIVVTASARRSQLDNRRAAAARLARILLRAMAPAPPGRRPTKPSAAAVQARLDTKRRRAQLKRQRRSPDD